MDKLYGDALLEVLQRARENKKNCTDPVEARYWAIQITELEKAYALWYAYIMV